ncbi:phosphopantetheine-binding protein [Azospirillum sp. sgz302134]
MSIDTRKDCWNAVVESLNALLDEKGEEPGDLTPETRLSADLGISSVEAIHLMIHLEDRLEQPLSFEKLAVRDGEYVQDITLGELLAFLMESLGISETV